VIPSGVEIFLAVGAIDLRWGFNRLTGVVEEHIGRDVRSGALFLFLGRRRDALKILFFDGTGMCLFYKRLDAGCFRLPERCGEAEAGAINVDETELSTLLDGPGEAKPAGIDASTKEEADDHSALNLCL
jgi:transposase